MIYLSFEDENLGLSFDIFCVNSQIIYLTKYGVAHSKFVKHIFWKFIEGDISAFWRIENYVYSFEKLKN